jgi:hypothetical protein
MAEQLIPDQKEKILSMIRQEHLAFEQTLALFEPSQMVGLKVEGEWTIKDMLVHITVWEKRMVMWLDQAEHGMTPAMPAPGVSWEELDHLNDLTYQANRDRPLEDVLADFHQSYQDVLLAVQAMPELDLFYPDRFAWREGKPLWKIVAANTWWHYRDHCQAIDQFLEKSG